MNKATLVWSTPEAERIIGYCARVSNPANQDNPDYAKLLAYCIKNKHWSIFEMGNMCVQIETSRAISAQILRHRSFTFQEFSQRYATVTDFEPIQLRKQDSKNRQNSTDDLEEELKTFYDIKTTHLLKVVKECYDSMVEAGIAKECARMVLPMTSSTKLYMNGTIRSWIHYLELRTANGTQLEHKQVADAIKEIFKKEFPVISEALGWIE